MGLGIFWGGKPPGAVSRGPVHAHPLWRRGARSSSPSSPLAKKAKKKKKIKKFKTTKRGGEGRGGGSRRPGKLYRLCLGTAPTAPLPLPGPRALREAAPRRAAGRSGAERSRRRLQGRATGCGLWASAWLHPLIPGYSHPPGQPLWAPGCPRWDGRAAAGSPSSRSAPCAGEGGGRERSASVAHLSWDLGSSEVHALG